MNGLSKVLGDQTQVIYHKGCNIISNKIADEELEDENWIENEDVSIAEAAQIAGNADVAIVVVGTNLSIANEGGDKWT